MRHYMLAIILLIWAQAATAAEIRFVSSAENDIQANDAPNCNLRLSGQIEKGDATRLAGLIRANAVDGEGTRNVFYPVLCLDSPGGSFAEAVRIIAVIDETYIGTMIENGSRCESACALAFMAGVYPEEGNVYPWRMMHPGGRLGFHAPDLRLPAGQYNEADITRAYRIALKSVSQTIEKLVMAGTGRTRRMRPSLLAAMLATPSDAMHYVDTVDKAGRWQINIVAVGKLKRLSNATLVRGCSNLRAWQVDEAASFDGTIAYEGAKVDQDYSLARVNENTVRMLFFGMYEEGCEITMNEKTKLLSGGAVTMTAIDDVGTSEHLGLVGAAAFHDPRTGLADLR